jgi:hypothetical protein
MSDAPADGAVRAMLLLRRQWNAGGTEFAEGGFFRAAFGVCNIADPSDTYGVIWQPKQPPLRSTPVVPVPGRPGCYTYLVRSSEPYLSKVAEVFGVPLKQLLLDNTDRVTALDTSPVGKRLVICNPDPDVVRLVLPGGGTSPSRPGQPSSTGTATTTAAPATGPSTSTPSGTVPSPNAPPGNTGGQRGTNQPMRGTSQPQSTPGSRQVSTTGGEQAGGVEGEGGAAPAQPDTPPPTDEQPQQDEQEPPPPQQQTRTTLPRRTTTPRSSGSNTAEPQQEQPQVWFTRRGCTCHFFAEAVATEGRCNWYTIWGDGSPWCWTDQSDGRKCGNTKFLGFITVPAWDYMVGQPPPRACLK